MTRLNKPPRPYPAALLAPALVASLALSMIPGRATATAAYEALAEDDRPLLVAPGSHVGRLVETALAYNEERSSRPDQVRQRRSEEAALRWEKRPSLVPVSGIDYEGNVGIGLQSSMPIYDFGRHRARRKYGRAATALAELDYWIERNDVAGRVLRLVIDAAEARAHQELIEQSYDDLEERYQAARERSAGGVADEGELTLLQLRLAELDRDIISIRAQFRQTLALLENRLGRPVAAAEVPTPAVIKAAFLPLDDGSPASAPPAAPDPSPYWLRADLERSLARRRVDQALAEVVPIPVVQGSVVYSQGEFNPAVTVALENRHFPGFAGRDNLSAARSALAAARAAVVGIVRDLDMERTRLALTITRLSRRLDSLEDLIAQGQRSVDLYHEQRHAGVRLLADGITVYRTLLQAQRDQAGTFSERLRVTVETAGLDGRLAARVAVE